MATAVANEKKKKGSKPLARAASAPVRRAIKTLFL
jgi:hypothetical protein